MNKLSLNVRIFNFRLEIESLEKERNELELTMRSLKSSTHQRRQKKHFEELKSLSSKNGWSSAN